MVYFQVIYTLLRDPIRKLVEKRIMEQRTDPHSKARLPEFLERLRDEDRLEGRLEGERAMLLRLVARVGIALTPEDQQRIEQCKDGATLERWLDNVLGAKSAADIFR